MIAVWTPDRADAARWLETSPVPRCGSTCARRERGEVGLRSPKARIPLSGDWEQAPTGR
jgi:hypothetical protein